MRLCNCALLRVRTFGSMGGRIFVLIAVAAVVGFYYAVLMPMACELAGHPAGGASRVMTMKSLGSVQSIPHKLQVRLRVIPERQQRYDTVGDWLWNDNTLEIRVSREAVDKDPRYAMLVFVHELIEALLCRATGVSAAQVDAFDMSHPQAEEPGADPSAPYHRQHMAAEVAERALAEQVGVKWKDYIGRWKLNLKQASRRDFTQTVNRPRGLDMGPT